MTDWSGKYSPEEFYRKTISLQCYPSFKHLIEMQLSFYQWWIQADSGFIIRGYQDFPRARIYKMPNGTVFASSDNEACVSFYEYTYHNGGNPFVNGLFGLFQKERLFLSYPIQKDKSYNSELFISDASLSPFRMGGATGDPFRSVHQLKLSHYLEAAENLHFKVSPKHRCGVFLSPLNVVLTPKTPRIQGNNASGFYHGLKKDGGRFSLYKKDVGETRVVLEILHAFLIRDLLEIDNGLLAYKAYCDMCQLDFQKQIALIPTLIHQSRDYQFDFDKASKRAENVRHKIPQIGDRKEKAWTSEYKGKAVSVGSTRFYVTQNHYDDLVRYPECDLYIEVNPRKGNHPKGHYLIPNKVAKSFIESKQGKHNWNKHQNFKQDAIPSDLIAYFTNS